MASSPKPVLPPHSGSWQESPECQSSGPLAQTFTVHVSELVLLAFACSVFFVVAVVTLLAWANQLISLDINYLLVNALFTMVHGT